MRDIENIGSPVRTLALFIAASATFAISLEITALVQSGYSVVDAVVRLSRFFTIITNVALAVSCAAIASGFFRPVALRIFSAITAAMLLSAVVHLLILRGVQSPEGIRYLASAVLHQVNPVLTLCLWVLLTTCRDPMRWSDPLVWSLFPLAYLIYALIRIGLGEDPAYPFFDFRALGWSKVVLFSGAIAAAFIILGEMLVGLHRYRTSRTLRM